ncbi:hypothetical protein [Brevibacillus sp. SYSU BS000544]|uniref:hypothetical protein n=1 Tax=Brevibacillus sp. SYSU BS000544 TaxID=3416443 RepID=UPI003CE5954B
MEVQVWMASKEVADRLNVHVRTLRNWLDLFVPITDKQKNPQGHYLISELGFHLLKEVKVRKDAGNSSLRDIQQQLFAEGLLTESMIFSDEAAGTATSETALVTPETLHLQSSFRDIEVTVNETLFHFQQELANLASVQQMQTAILQKLADVEEKQESLRLEMRRVTFEMDLMHQRLTRRKNRSDRNNSRWSLNPFRWFSRSNTNNIAAD